MAADTRSHDERLVLAATALQEASARLLALAEKVRTAQDYTSKPAIRDECDKTRAAIGQVSDHLLRLYMDVIAEELS